jgi:phosphate uptake regulator
MSRHGLAVIEGDEVVSSLSRRHPAKALPEEVNGYFTEMGRIAVDIGNSVKDIVLSRDPDRAAELANDDDDMDHLHRHLFSVLMDTQWKHGVAGPSTSRSLAAITSGPSSTP